ncbi:hypothetical protein BH23GEM9_BH23GEM9_20550 [soil metagenome]
MRRPRRTSFALLLVYLLALLLPQHEDLVLPGATACTWYDASRSESVLSLYSHAGAPAVAGHAHRVLVDGGRPPASLLDQVRYDGLGMAACQRNGRNSARAVVALLQHASVRQAIRSAGAGFSASPPRAPPVLLNA